MLLREIEHLFAQQAQCAHRPVQRDSESRRRIGLNSPRARSESESRNMGAPRRIVPAGPLLKSPLRHGVAEIPIDGLDRVPRAWRHREYATKESQVSSHRADEVVVADKSALLEAIEVTAGTPWRSVSSGVLLGCGAKQFRRPGCPRAPRRGVWAGTAALLAAALCAPS